MLKKILSSLAMGGREPPPPPAPPPVASGFAPYKNDAFNQIYNLLFCDNRDLFRASRKSPEDGPWIVLADNPSVDALRAIAEDESQESRLRMLAYNRLREMGASVPTKKLLGVVVEVGLEHGLDVVAAYPDGRARYINQVEKMSVFETAPPEVAAKIPPLLAAAQEVVNQSGRGTRRAGHRHREARFACRFWSRTDSTSVRGRSRSSNRTRRRVR